MEDDDDAGTAVIAQELRQKWYHVARLNEEPYTFSFVEMERNEAIDEVGAGLIGLSPVPCEEAGHPWKNLIDLGELIREVRAPVKLMWYAFVGRTNVPVPHVDPTRQRVQQFDFPEQEVWRGCVHEQKLMEAEDAAKARRQRRNDEGLVSRGSGRRGRGPAARGNRSRGRGRGRALNDEQGEMEFTGSEEDDERKIGPEEAARLYQELFGSSGDEEGEGDAGKRGPGDPDPKPESVEDSRSVSEVGSSISVCIDDVVHQFGHTDEEDDVLNLFFSDGEEEREPVPTPTPVSPHVPSVRAPSTPVEVRPQAGLLLRDLCRRPCPLFALLPRPLTMAPRASSAPDLCHGQVRRA